MIDMLFRVVIGAFIGFGAASGFWGDFETGAILMLIGIYLKTWALEK